jgi:uncharacterized membrane protein YagU involved in acid resistance
MGEVPVQHDVMALIEGGISGVLGTLSMSTVMLAARRAGLVGQLPPERITEAALDAAGQRRSKEVQDALAVILHLLFGAFLGSFFGLLHRRLRVPLGSALQGLVYGLLMWSVNYKGWIPALSILPPPERDRPDRPLIVAFAHVVYGWTTAAVVDARERSSRE